MSNFFEKRRNELGMTVRQIADSFDPRMTTAAVYQWEKGITAPQMTRVDEVAKVFKVSRAKILEAIHQIAMTRQEAAASIVTTNEKGETVRIYKQELLFDPADYKQCVSYWKGIGIHAMEEANGYARRARKRFNIQIPLPFPTLDDAAA